MHYKYLNNNLRTFVEILDQLIYALFTFHLFIFAPPHPAMENVLCVTGIFFSVSHLPSDYSQAGRQDLGLLAWSERCVKPRVFVYQVRSSLPVEAECLARWFVSYIKCTDDIEKRM